MKEEIRKKAIQRYLQGEKPKSIFAISGMWLSLDYFPFFKLANKGCHPITGNSNGYSGQTSNQDQHDGFYH